ncbi:hypothetical protein M885DRAFT_544945, partial [Pelagophyceae sp. CCMP2097]
MARASRHASTGRLWAAWRSRDIVVAEIVRVLEHDVQRGSAPSPDDWIVYESILNAGPAAIFALSLCYTAIIDGSDHPDSWTTIFLTWIYKKGDPLFWTNFRGVAKATVLLKVFERVLKNRYDVWCSVFWPMCWRQDESNPGVDCRMQLWLVRETLAYQLYARGLTSLVMAIGLKRAFPTTVREYSLLAMLDMMVRVMGIEGDAWLDTMWRLQRQAGVKLATANGNFSDTVPHDRGILEGRVPSADLFAAVLDCINRLLEESGIGARLTTRDGTSVFVGSVFKTDDILLIVDPAPAPLPLDNNLRLAYGIVKAWMYYMSYDLALTKNHIMATRLPGTPSMAGGRVSWSWKIG